MNHPADDTHAKLLIRDGFLWEAIDDGCLLYHSDSGAMLTLNAAAEVVLAHCTGEFSVDEMLTVVQREFGITHEEALKALESLRTQGVVD